MSASFAVRLSTLDWRSHAFPASDLTQAKLSAACGHVVVKDATDEAYEPSPTCVPCAVVFGAAEADRMDSVPNPSRWEM